MTSVLHTAVDVEIERSPGQVWDVVSDYESDRRWRKGILEMTPDADGPPRVGTKVREVLKLGGRRYTTDTEVTEVGPGLSYRFAGAGDSGRVRGRRSVRAGAMPGTAVFTYEVDLEPERVPAPVRPLMRRWLEHSLRHDLRRLRGLLETG
jgi:polyketide cyclase/dehydrase/lipid transport protein